MAKSAAARTAHFGLFGACLALYLIVSLRHLQVTPKVYEDEPWQASAGWKLATQGVFGSDMFSGFYGMESHVYAFMPLHPMLLAATYRLIGLGLFQTRLEPVMLGLLLIALTYALGRRLFDASVGLLAVALMLLVRFTTLTPSQPTGILLLDIARIARYDMLAAVLGLASLHVYLTASRRSDWRYHAVAGLLASLAAFAHLYGGFWLIALAALTIWNRAGWRALLALLIGFALPWPLYLAYLSTDPADWLGQVRDYAPRFDLLNPAWYLGNLRDEYLRYSPGLGSPGWHYLLRPGFWIVAMAVPASGLALMRRAGGRGDHAARVLVAPLFVFPALFALLIHLKLINYLIAVLPLGALAMAWGGVALWRRGEPLRRGQWLRAALAVVALCLLVEGAGRVAALEATAATTTPYRDFIGRVRASIPPGSRVLGLHHYWLGLHDLDYRSWFVPILQSDPNYSQPPRPIEAALDAIAPDVILIDPRLREYLQSPGAPSARGVLEWMERRSYELAATIDDATYGLMEIYRRNR